jgi:hypothetical protein
MADVRALGPCCLPHLFLGSLKSGAGLCGRRFYMFRLRGAVFLYPGFKVGHSFQRPYGARF